MFDGFKAFASGWNAQGRNPRIPLSITRPYSEIVVRYFEDVKMYSLLRLAICDQAEETLPFEFSYQVLPFAMARAMAVVTSNGDEEYHRAVNSVLRDIAVAVGKNRPDVEVDRIIRNPDEIAHLHKIARAVGVTDSLKTFARSPICWATMLDVVYSVRFLSLQGKLLATASIAGERPEKTLAFFHVVAQEFLSNSTAFPSPSKQDKLALHVGRLFFAFTEIPRFPPQ